MRWTRLFIPTTREVPAGADAVSHQLLLRAGYIRQVTAGVYALLPLAQRMRLKIINIIRQEMERIGGQEFVLSALQPAELWKESGRWHTLDEIAFRLRDRKRVKCSWALLTKKLLLRWPALVSIRTGSCPKYGTKSRPNFAMKPGPSPGFCVYANLR